MDHHSTVAVGSGNIRGDQLHNVGNEYHHSQVIHVHGPQGLMDQATAAQQAPTAPLALLESKAALDALLKSGTRHPAPKCHVDTRKAAQSAVTNWICWEGDCTSKGIMWMSGGPGVGKSAIAQTVCEALDVDDGSKSWLAMFGLSDGKVHGSHFFGRGQGKREKAYFFPATIAYQLYRSRPTCRDVIKKTLKKHPRLFDESFPSQFRQLLIKTARKRWIFQSPITIVIDALDECDNAEDQTELLNLILEAVNSGHMRFLIASRPEQHIQSFFLRDDVSQHTYHIQLDDKSFETSRDIKVFLLAEFARIRRSKPLGSCPSLSNGEDWPGKLVILQLTDDSDSQFMYARLCIDYINTSDFPDESLRNLLSARSPHAFFKLDILYHLILSRRSPAIRREGEAALHNYQHVLMGILQIVVAWPGDPISAPQIARILREKVSVVQGIIRGSMCSLFKFKPDDLDSPIILCHKSLRDYLLVEERSHEFFIPAGDGDALFVHLLSHEPSSSSSQPNSREVLMGVLEVIVVLGPWVKQPRIAAALGVPPTLVENVIYGPAKALFDLDDNNNISFSTPFLKVFLLSSVKRAGDYFIPSDSPDALFAQILSRPPSSDPSSQPYSRQDLVGALTVVVMLEDGVKIPQLASALNVAPRVVEAIIFGPSRALFEVDIHDTITLSTPSLKVYLLDASRAGDFYLPLNSNYRSLSAKIQNIRDGHY